MKHSVRPRCRSGGGRCRPRRPGSRVLAAGRVLGLLAALLASAACDGEPLIPDGTADGSLTVRVGPGGAEIRGEGGTRLERLRIQIPAGALDRFVELDIASGPPIAQPGTSSAAGAIRLRARPDPGILRIPAVVEIRVAAALPSDEQLLVLGRTPAPEGDPPIGAPSRPVVLADGGTYDPQTGLFAFEVARLFDFEVRQTAVPRQRADADRLVDLGYDALGTLSSNGLATADLLFSEAQLSDPYSPAANLFRALTRVLVLLDDRTDIGPELDSVGDALERFGIVLGPRSLWERLAVDGLDGFPRTFAPRRDAPTAAELFELWRARLRPGIELALSDLDRVAETTALRVAALDPSTALGQILDTDTDIDVADVVALRGVLEGVLFAVAALEDLDLEADYAVWGANGDPMVSLEDWLARFPGLGRRRAPTGPEALSRLAAAVAALRDAVVSVQAETDDQTDDLLVFPEDFGRLQQDRWISNFTELGVGLRGGRVAVVDPGDGFGPLRLDPRTPFLRGTLDPRLALPGFRAFLPLAAGLPDPTFGGLFPSLDAAEFVERFGLVARAPELPVLDLRIDGLVGDWIDPAAELVADPSEPVGDVVGGLGVEAVDLAGVYAARSPLDRLLFRWRLAPGESFASRSGQESVYAVRIRDLEPRGYGPREVLIEVVYDSAGVGVGTFVDGQPVPVRFDLGAEGRELELSIDRFDLFGPDTLPRERVVEWISQGSRVDPAESAEDRSRLAVVVF